LMAVNPLLRAVPSMLVEGNDICIVYIQLIRCHPDDRSTVIKVDQEL
jgi:hypothetical protein